MRQKSPRVSASKNGLWLSDRYPLRERHQPYDSFMVAHPEFYTDGVPYFAYNIGSLRILSLHNNADTLYKPAADTLNCYRNCNPPGIVYSLLGEAIPPTTV